METAIFIVFALLPIVFIYGSEVNGTGEQIDYTSERYILQHLLDNYHKIDLMTRPHSGGPPDEVHVNLNVESLHSISEANMDYAMTVYYRQYWLDPRLKFDNTTISELTIDGTLKDKIWLPDSFFVNAKDEILHESPKQNSYIRIGYDGNVFTSYRITLVLACDMELELFPFDIQICHMRIESYGYRASEVIVKWLKPDPIKIDKDRLKLPQYTLRNFYYDDGIMNYSTGNFSHVEVNFIFGRQLGFYVFLAYIPSAALVILSWLTLWIEATSSPARTTLGITTALALVTQSTWLRGQIPKVTYVTAIDIWMTTCEVLVFAIMIEFVFVYYLYKMEERRQVSHFDNHGRKLLSRENRGSLGDLKVPNKGSSWSISSSVDSRDRSSLYLSKENLWLPTEVLVTNPKKKLEGKTLFRRKGKSLKVTVTDYRKMGLTFDQYCRPLFLIVFLAFNAFYWTKYMKDEFTPEPTSDTAIWDV
ncbi:glycine receptor subunit alphaZ1-like [Glandiceps talaboti]